MTNIGALHLQLLYDEQFYAHVCYTRSWTHLPLDLFKGPARALDKITSDIPFLLGNGPTSLAGR
jgi:hypothetical protein